MKTNRWIFATIAAALALLSVSASAQESEPKTNPAELQVHKFIVPPNFFREVEEIAVARRTTARKALEKYGIDFPEGASVFYAPGTGTLIIRNTIDQVEIVKDLIGSLASNPERKQVFVSFKEFRFNPEDFQKKKGKINENSILELLLSEPIVSDRKSVPKNIAGTVRESTEITTQDDLLDKLSRPAQLPPVPEPVAPKGETGIAGVFNNPQFLLLLQALKEEKEVDLLSAPSVLLRSGQAGLSQVNRQRWGAVAEIGADDLTIDLSLYLPKEGEALYADGEKARAPTVEVTLWDAQTVAFRERVSEDQVRVVLVTAKIVDPAGIPVRKEKPKGVSAGDSGK